LSLLIEEPVMHARFVPIAAVMLIGSAAFAAEPVKPAAQPATQPQPRPEVMLASADQVPASPPREQQAAAPDKHPRAGRVTTCRCGDTQAQPER
jgi:hypothetical protein